MKNYQENPFFRLIVILLSVQGVVISTSLISQGIILPITNYIGDTLPIASLVIWTLIYIYLVLGIIAFLVLSLVFSNVKRDFISAYSLTFNKKMVGNLVCWHLLEFELFITKKDNSFMKRIWRT